MEQIEWELLGESPRTEINRLIEFYKKDKAKARIIYHQDKTKYYYNRVVLFNKPNGNFDIVNFIVTYGISSTGIIYHRQRRYSTIIYKDKKFYTTNGAKGPKNFTQLTYYGLEAFVNGIYRVEVDTRNKVYKLMSKKFTWIRWIEENHELHDMCFNTIVRYKLKKPKDCLRHKYGVPINIAKIVHSGQTRNHGGEKGNLKVWKEMKKVLFGVQNLTPELYNNHLFFDICKMAGALGKKVNCSWKENRLKEEHDAWSKEITRTVLEYAELQKLDVAKIYLAFAAYSGYKVLRTNKDMIWEGKTQNHCVATYISEVDKGDCAIYHINGYTLQLKKPNSWGSHIAGGYIRDTYIDGTPKSAPKKLIINQFKGLSNKNASPELYAEVQTKLDEFSLLKEENYDELLIDFPEVPNDYNLKDKTTDEITAILNADEIDVAINGRYLPF